MITYRHVHCIAGDANLMPWGTKKENTVFPAILSHRRGEILFVDGFSTNILAAVVQTSSLNRKNNSNRNPISIIDPRLAILLIPLKVFAKKEK